MLALCDGRLLPGRGLRESLEHSTRYARHVGNLLGVAVPEKDLASVREELDPEYWELSERVFPDPQYNGSYEQRPDSLKSPDAPIPHGARQG
jgi:hypothetical protein